MNSGIEYDTYMKLTQEFKYRQRNITTSKNPHRDIIMTSHLIFLILTDLWVRKCLIFEIAI